MSNIDYDLKSRVIELGLDEIQRQVSKSIFYHYYPNENVECSMSYDLAVAYDNFYSKKHPELWEEAKKINHARYKRTKHLKHYIKKMLNLGQCIFLTLTFSDTTFSKVSDKSRKSYVQRFLKSYDTLYIANKDFGGKKGREHYHAVIRTENVDFSKWLYGAINGERIRSNEDSSKLAQYVSKLTNHAIKETTKRSSLMYSRMTFAEYEKKYNKSNIIFEELDTTFLPFEEGYMQDCLFS